MIHKILFKSISVILIFAFLWQEIDWACPAMFCSLRPLAAKEKPKIIAEDEGIEPETQAVISEFLHKTTGISRLEVPLAVYVSIMKDPTNPDHIAGVLRPLIENIPEARGRKAKAGISPKEKAKILGALAGRCRQLLQQIQAAQRRAQERKAKEEKQARQRIAERRRQIATWMQQTVCQHLRGIAQNNFLDFSVLRRAGEDQNLPKDLRNAWQDFVGVLENHYLSYQRPDNHSELVAVIYQFINLFNQHWLSRHDLFMMSTTDTVEPGEENLFRLLERLVILHSIGRCAVRRGSNSVDIVILENEYGQDTAYFAMGYSQPLSAIIAYPGGYEDRVNNVWAAQKVEKVLRESSVVMGNQALEAGGFIPATYRAILPVYADHWRIYRSPERYLVQTVLDIMGEEVRHWLDAIDVAHAAGRSFPVLDEEWAFAFAQFKLRSDGFLHQIFNNLGLPVDTPNVPLSAEQIAQRQLNLAQCFYELSGRMTGMFTAEDPTIELVSGLNRLISVDDQERQVQYVTLIMVELLAHHWNFIQGELTVDRAWQLIMNGEIYGLISRVIERMRQQDGAQATRLALRAIYAEQYQGPDGGPAHIDEPPFAEVDADGNRIRPPEYEAPLKMALSGSYQRPEAGAGPLAAGALFESRAREILSKEQDYLKYTFDDYERAGIYKKYGLQKPRLPLLEFKAIEGDEQYTLREQEDRLVLTFDINKIRDATELLGLYWDILSGWYFRTIADISDKISTTPDFLAEDATYLNTMSRYYISNCGIRENDVVLDIGTYRGTMAILASRLTNNRVFGIDISPGVIDKAKENAQNERALNTEFIVGNVADLDKQFPPSSIDIAISNYTFTTVPPFLRVVALGKIYQVLGRRLNLWEYPAKTGGYSRAWTPQEWNSCLSLAGFCNISVTTVRQEGEVIAYFIQADKPQEPPAQPQRPAPQPRDIINSV